jgi:hypothetical protein
MTQLITALFADPEHGQAAADALKNQGFEGAAVRLVTRLSGQKSKSKGAEGSDEGFIASLTKDGVTRADAIKVADAIRGGGSFVGVHAPFGSAQLAIRILKSHEATDQASYLLGGEAASSSKTWLLSEALGLKLLIDDPTPFSRFWQVRVLDNGYSFSAKLGWRLLSDTDGPFTTSFGYKLLSHSPTPLSDWLGWGLLSHDPTPLSRRFGWRLLSDDPTPLSRWFGWPLLLERKFFF